MTGAITKTGQLRSKSGKPRINCLWCCLLVMILLFLIGVCVRNLFWNSSSAPLSPPSSLPSAPVPPTSSPPSSLPSAPVPFTSSPPSPSPSVLSFSNRPIPQPIGEEINLRNAYFDINTPASELEIRICVRDHSCVDGDRIQLSVNGSEVYRGEIYNTPSCVVVPVHSGENDLRLYAINGTGGKGENCSYEQINTGQIIIESINWKSALWGLAPGSSSYAKVNIMPR